MRRISHILLLTCVLGALLGCNSRTDRTDGGGILLSVSDFDGLPIAVSVSGAGAFLQIGQIDIQSIVKNPTGGSSDLMTVEMRSYEVTFSRGDAGEAIPTPFVRGIFGSVAPNGTITYDNLPVMSSDQLANPPLGDLASLGVDPETGNTKIILNLRLRFFGRTLSGNEVQTEPVVFTIDFLP